MKPDRITVKSCNFWTPPGRSIATRRPARRSRYSFRGATYYAFQNRELVFESLLELNFTYLAMTDHRVVDIHDQPPAVPYLDGTGRQRKHVFDFLLKFENGFKLAVAIKPQRKVASSKIEEIIERIAASPQGRAFADRFVVRTEVDITRDRVENARWILRARRLRNEEDIAVLREIVGRLKGEVRIDALLSQFRADGRGLNAVINLIDEGRLQLVQPKPISRESFVAPVPAPFAGGTA